MRHHDGSSRWERIESDLRRDGYVLKFTCMYGAPMPDDLGWTGKELGWEMRRRIRD